MFPTTLFMDAIERHIRLFLPTSCFQAPRPSPSPHKLRESLPLLIFLRNRLKYAPTGREVASIVQQRLIKVEGKFSTDNTYLAGFMGTIPLMMSHLTSSSLDRCSLH